ncbi:AfsR/SARP family transcriptional regulator [Sciscionella marina]|uniref:AfsR/SARP family transcriptional regulator n=1 Tax=Sciscionella marina TaxID=508770 RepID=UPI0003773F45|nr:BTAD domain-containing putative transcriptional regulator [Sciscionella marina]
MRYRLLGPLTLDDAPLEHRRQRTVLAALLVHAGKPVPLAALIDELWSDPPESAQVMVQMCISELRKSLAPGVAARDPGQVLRGRRGGYTLDVPGGELDQTRFLRLAEHGNRLACEGRADEASAVLHDALDLWRGAPLADVDGGPALSAHAAWLANLRTVAMERAARVDFELGRYAEVIAMLQVEVLTDPAQEALAAHLVKALAATGRRGEAANVFEQVRFALDEQLGVRPGNELIDALRSIEPANRPSDPPAAQLPPQLGDFTGRRDLLADIHALFEETDGPRVLVLCGQGGIGKTTLAVRAAHLLRERFPGGQLAANLREDGSRIHETLARFLRALGVDEYRLPADHTERRQLWRSHTARAEVLVLLDDAANEAQVRELLPTGSRCAAIVTSRRRLLGLEGARTIEVPELPGQDAAELLDNLVGAHRVAAEPGQAERLLALCAGLPLAVRIVGATLAAAAHEPIRELADRIADRHRNLLRLRAGDLDVRATLEVGIAECDAAARRALCLLGAFRFATFTAWTVAALTDTPESEATDILRGLVTAQLVQAAGRDRLGSTRYRMHELIAACCAERADAAEVDAALDRICAGYLLLAGLARRTLRRGWFPPDEPDAAPESATAHAVVENPGGWCREELANLIAVIGMAFERGWWSLTAQLSGAFAGIAEPRPGSVETRQVTILGLVAARQSGDQGAEARSLCALGDLRWDIGQAKVALPCYSLAIRRFEASDDRPSAARVLLARSEVLLDLGRLGEVRADLHAAMHILEREGDRLWYAQALRQLGSLLFDIGEIDEALRLYQEGRQLILRHGTRHELARASKTLADIHSWHGDHAEAERLLAESFDIATELADRHWRAHVLRSIGNLRRREGRLTEADKALGESLTLFEELQHSHARAYTLRWIGELRLDQGDPVGAEQQFLACQTLCYASGDRRGQGYARYGLGKCRLACGEIEAGNHLLHSAARIFGALGFHRCVDLVESALKRI